MFEILYSVSTNIAVSAASKVLNLLFEELRHGSPRKAEGIRSLEVRDYSERLRSDRVAAQLYEEAIKSRRTKSPQLSEDELQKLTRALSEAIQARLAEEGKVDKSQGRKLLEDLRNTVP